MRRSTPSAGRLPNGRSDQLQPPDGCPVTEAINSQPPDGCPAGEGLITPTRRTGPRTESYVKSVVSIRAACEGPASTPLQQHSLLGDSTVMPVQQGSRTQGFYGRKPWKKPNSTLIIARPRPAKEGLRRPFRNLPPNRSLKLTANPPHSRPGYRHNSRRVSVGAGSRVTRSGYSRRNRGLGGGFLPMPDAPLSAWEGPAPA